MQVLSLTKLSVMFLNTELTVSFKIYLSVQECHISEFNYQICQW